MNENESSASDSIPRTDGYPVVGSLPSLVSRPFEFLERYGDEHGMAFELDVPRRDAYVFATPSAVEHVLISNHEAYEKGAFRPWSEDLLGNGLLLSEGSFWRRQRKFVQPALVNDPIEAHADAVVDHTADLLAHLPDAGVVNVYDRMMDLTLVTIGDALTSVSERDDAETFHEAFSVVSEHAQRIGDRPVHVPTAVPTPANLRYRRALDSLDAIVYDLIETRRAGKGPDDDLLGAILAAERESDAAMTDEELRDEILTLLFAGHETTALALSYAWMLLAENPDAQRRLHEELDDVVGDRPPELTDLPDLEYTEQVVMEAMRLYPPVYAVVREATQDDEVTGYEVPEGALLALPQWLAHRNEAHYDAPEEFHPERWTASFRSSLPDMAYFPFGAGPRHCVGRNFAMLEAKLVVATLGRELRFELTEATDPELVAAVTTRPKNGIDLRITPREEV